MSVDRLQTRTTGVPAYAAEIGSQAHDPASGLVYINSTGLAGGWTSIGASPFAALTNGEAFSILTGEVVYISATDTVMLADNSTQAKASVVGVVTADILTTATGLFFTLYGSVITDIQLVTGLGVAPTAGTDLFVSATPGSLTPTMPGSGLWSKPVARVLDSSAYVGTTKADSKIKVFYGPEPSTLIP